MVLELMSVSCGHCHSHAAGTENSYLINGPAGTNTARFLGLEVNATTDSASVANFISTYNITFPIANNVPPVAINYQLYYTPGYYVIYPDYTYTTICVASCVTAQNYMTIEGLLNASISAWNPPVYGCMDSTASNYNQLATVSNDSCDYTSYTITTIGMSFSPDTIVCDVGDTINFVLGVNHNAVEVSDSTWLAGGTAPLSGGFSYGFGATGMYIPDDCHTFYYVCQPHSQLGMKAVIIAHHPPVFGCTDSLAFNYDPLATVDDGTCTYPTCSEGSPTGLFTSDVIHNRATINWDNMNSTLCFVDQYRIQYRESGTTSWSQKTMSGPVGSCNYASQKTDKLILNLTANTTYEYQMKAWYCGGGASSWSGIETFTTLDNCPNVGNLAVYGATPTKATFTWDASNGVYSFVRLKARVDSISNPTGADFFQIGGAGVAYGTNTKNKNGLTPGETYRGQARTYCNPNGGPWKSLTWTPLVYWTQPTQRIEGGEAISHLDVYPNPSKDVFNISFTSERVQDLRVRVLNVVGEEIVKEELQQFVGEYVKLINLNLYSKGLYFLEIETNDGIINKKLVLQ